jgi:superfamily II DNA or RNA helicase
MEIRALAKAKRNDLGSNGAFAKIDLMKRELTLEQKGSEKFGFGGNQTIRCYREVADWIEVPRQYAVRNLNVDLDDQTTQGEDATFSYTGTLRDYQEPLVNDFLDQIAEPKNQFGGILSAKCGTGKTVMSTWLSAKLGRKTCVLVHAGFLMKQWKESFLQFTDLTEDDIGTVQQATCDWEGKKVVIAMVESLVSDREYPPEMFESFGVVIADEVHRHGALEWSKAIQMFPAKLRIGLSATPRRVDGLWNVIRWHVGDVLVKAKHRGEAASVAVINTGIGLPKNIYTGRGRAKINLPRLITALTRIGKRNDAIMEEVVQAVRAGRRPLILSDRLEHLDTLQAMFFMMWDGDDIPVGRYVGGMKDKQIEEARRCQLLFGTYQYAKEGLDDETLDTLFLVTPKSDVEQAVGRIQRSHPDKKRPLVVDFVDEQTGPCVGFAKRRRWLYGELGFDMLEPVRIG